MLQCHHSQCATCSALPLHLLMSVLETAIFDLLLLLELQGVGSRASTMCHVVCRPLFEHGSQLAAVAALQGCLQQLKQTDEPGAQEAVSELERIFENAGASIMPQVG